MGQSNSPEWIKDYGMGMEFEVGWYYKDHAFWVMWPTMNQKIANPHLPTDCGWVYRKLFSSDYIDLCTINLEEAKVKALILHDE